MTHADHTSVMCGEGRVPIKDIAPWLGTPFPQANGAEGKHPLTFRVFPGKPEQAAAVRAFVRSVLAGHPARDDAELIASELAANAVRHTASGMGGMFAVAVAVPSATVASVLVVDQGAYAAPAPGAASRDADHGRGLQVIAGLATELKVYGDARGRDVLAVLDTACATAGRW